MSQPNQQCMGIDVAKLSLDIATTTRLSHSLWVTMRMVSLLSQIN